MRKAKEEVFKNDDLWELNKKSTELRMRVKINNQKEYHKLVKTLEILNLKKKHNMDTYNIKEKEFKTYLKSFQEKIQNITSHLKNGQIDDIKRNYFHTNLQYDASKSIYSKISKTFNLEKNYTQDWDFIESSVKKIQPTRQGDANEDEIQHLNEKNALNESVNSTVSLPSISSKFSESGSYFIKPTKVDFEQVFMYKKYYSNRQNYANKAANISVFLFSCH